ncbi:MAG: ATP-binding protein, partial [Candidatus Gracilibacteria bacterium]
MTAKVFSCTVLGLNGHIVEVEADISSGLPQFNIVGLGDASVQESKERVRSSIKNCGLEFPQTRKTINLAPAQIRKQGALFDLPIALSILISSKQISADIFDNAIVIGELSLEGRIKPVSGILPITEHAKLHGFRKIFLPAANATEASFIDGIDIYPLNHLKDLLQLTFTKYTKKFIPQPPSENIDDFTKIIGLEYAKRALQIAAAGRHNLFLIGSPGCGKTILCRALKTLISPMSKNEILETTKVFSVSGLLSPDQPLITNRPFREVHHTASRVAVVGGGGSAPKPGEISLAHNGVLFLDEIAEFSRDTL